MTVTGVTYEQEIKKTHTRLKTNSLNVWEVLAQAVALISPSMTAALIVPLMFGTAGTVRNVYAGICDKRDVMAQIEKQKTMDLAHRWHNVRIH